ncbi:MAG: DUF4384 domain-containing protein [Gemmatimonadaceae bacterium]
MLTLAASLAVAIATAPITIPLTTSPAIARRATAVPIPSVRVWLPGDDLLRQGEDARLYFRTDEDAYVTVVRVDTEGELDILFPARASESGRVRGGRTYPVEGDRGVAFRANEQPGLGYVFAIASTEPFDFSRAAWWRFGSYRAGSRIHGDPFVAAQEFAEQLLGGRDDPYVLDHVEYHVGHRSEYPRYLCYGCHSGRSHSWDPYAYRCSNFRVVVYDDPYYYPYRYYPSSRVVYAREPARPRYEFKTVSSRDRAAGAGAGAGGDPIVEHRQRDDNFDLRRPGSPTRDPNILAPRAGDPGATRPGDDVGTGTTGRRRVRTDADDAPAPSDGPSARTPRRDPAESEGSEGRPRQDAPAGPRRVDGSDARQPARGTAGEAARREPRRDGGEEGRSGSSATPRREGGSAPSGSARGETQRKPSEARSSGGSRGSSPSRSGGGGSGAGGGGRRRTP